MKFILLIRDEAAFLALSPQQQGAVIERYSAWAKELREAGRLIDAEGLAPQAKILTGTSDGVVVTDGPFAETREVVGGYYVFTASSEEEALEIAKRCPSLSYNGTIELRQEMDYTP